MGGDARRVQPTRAVHGAPAGVALAVHQADRGVLEQPDAARPSRVRFAGDRLSQPLARPRATSIAGVSMAKCTVTTWPSRSVQVWASGMSNSVPVAFAVPRVRPNW